MKYVVIVLALFIGLLVLTEAKREPRTQPQTDKKKFILLRIKRIEAFGNRVASLLLIANDGGSVQRYFEQTILLSLAGIGIGLLFKNNFLSILLFFGLPFFQYQLLLRKTYEKRRNHNEKLEIYMSMVTNAYMQSGNLLLAVYENYKRMDPSETAAKPFKSFLSQAGRTTDLEQCVIDMKKDIDNKHFHQWCDKLALCLNNFSLKRVLPYSINRMQRARTVDMEMVTEAREHFIEYLIVCGFSLLICIGLPLTQPAWRHILTATLIGNLAIAVVFLIMLVSTAYVVKKTRPTGDRK